MLHGIFIVGCPRSGTTLLQSMLAAHPYVTSFPETKILSNTFKKIPKVWQYYLEGDARENARQFLIENNEDPKHYGNFIPNGSPLFWHLAAQTEIVDQFFRIFDAVAEKRGAAIWLEKTPVHLWFLPLIDRAAKRRNQRIAVVHLVRDGRPVVASLYRASGSWNDGPYSLSRCIRQWNRDIRATQRRLRKSPTDILVNYENLAKNTEQTIRLLCDQIDLPWDDRMLSKYSESAAKIGAFSHSYHSNLAKPIKYSNLFNCLFTEKQKKFVEKNLNMDIYKKIISEHKNPPPTIPD